jgi:hypothetical protein
MSKKIVQDEKALAEAYLNGKSATELAKEYKTSTRVISMTLARSGVKLRTLSESAKLKAKKYPSNVHFMHTAEVRKKLSENHANVSGENNPNFQEKGKRAIDGVWLTYDNHGYLRRKASWHPLARTDGYIAEHVYQACIKYGAEYIYDLVVHHINGIRDDNSYENLIAMGEVEHDRLPKKISLK